MSDSLQVATLRFDIRSYWLAGTGRGSGFHLDSLTAKDADGFPYLPGRTVKGLIRDAVCRAEQYGWYSIGEDSPAEPTRVLFGSPPDADDSTSPGLLRFSNARLPDDLRQGLRERPELAAHLYRPHFSTAIDRDRGAAKPGSLRGAEVVVPLTLYARISQTVPMTDSQASAASLTGRWADLVKVALPLIRGVGAMRTRGFGRAVVTLEAGGAHA